MKILSWNVNSVRVRIESFSEVLERCNPDILLLQETRVEDEFFPREYFEDRGYNLALCGQKGRNGVAVCSKYLLEEVRSDFCEEARYIEAFSNGIFVASVYVPNGREEDAPHYYYKLDFLRNLKDRFLTFKDEIFAAGGDFNVAPRPEDVYIDGYAGIAATVREREMLQAIREAGFLDILQDKGYTWWDYRSRGFSRDRGFRLDHFYLSKKARDIFAAGDVIRFARELNRPSDHAPILCELRI
jgi:exodeoxyribonuclease-3